MMGLIMLSYFIGAIINFFYGRYYSLFNMGLFSRAFIYPILAIIVELPNMLLIYIIHWDTYKP
jgi:hypothetical protein